MAGTACHQRQEHGDQRAQRGRESIDPVDEVVGVRDPHDPHDREDDVDHHPDPPRHEIQLDPGRDHAAGADDLEPQAKAGRESAGIVDGPRQHEHQGADRHGQQLVVAHGALAQGEDEGADHRDPAQLRRRQAVALARVGPIDRPGS